MKKLTFIKLMLVALITNVYAGEMSFEDGWIKAKKGVMTGAYITIINNTGNDDKLIGVKTDFAKKNEVHTVEMDDSGNAKMIKVDYVNIPNNTKTVFKRGGNHLMFMGLTQKIEVGKTYNITLIFEKMGEVKTSIIGRKK